MSGLFDDSDDYRLTLSYRRGAYTGPVYGPDHPCSVAYWEAALAGREPHATLTFPPHIDSDELRRYWRDGWRFGALTRIEAPQGVTRTRSGRRARDDVATFARR